jgi:hypothetical protein
MSFSCEQMGSTYKMKMQQCHMMCSFTLNDVVI